MTNKKMTKRDRYAQLLAIADVKNNAELVAFIEHELDLLQRKNSAEKIPTEKRMENEKIMKEILSTIKSQPMTISEMQKANETLCMYQNQKLSALLRQMIEKGEVERSEIKRKAYFKAI